MGHNSDPAAALEPKQEQLIFALLQHKTRVQAARAAGISRATMYRWFADPVFMAAYRAARRAVFDDGLAVLERNAEPAAQALVDEFGKDRTGSFAVILAARCVLDRAFKAQEAI